MTSTEEASRRPDTLRDVTTYLNGVQKLQEILNRLGYPGLRAGQDRIVANMLARKDTYAVLPTGGGKCFGKGTPILMYDGTVKPVETVKVGDKVMGPDSRPRIVTGLARGREQMFRIIPKRKGDPYIVNASHILSLKLTPTGKGENCYCAGRKFRDGDVANVSVKDYLQSSKTFRHRAKGWKTGVYFPNPVQLPTDMPPYILGLWLGDGGTGKSCISKPDPEIWEEVEAYAKSIGASVRYERKDSSKVALYVSVPEYSNGRKGGSNPMTSILKKLGVYRNKRIPREYLTATQEDRLELLAGLLDTDGHLPIGRSHYEITLNSKELMDDVAFLARSLGFGVTVKEKTVRLPDWDNARVYWRAHISGRTEAIPCRIPRKVVYGPSEPRKEVMLSGIDVQAIGEGDYYGFSVQGPDLLFLLGDFTVVHNSATFIVPTLCLNWHALVVSPLVALMRDQVQKLWDWRIAAGQLSGMQSDGENAHALAQWRARELSFLYVAPERLENPALRQALKDCRPNIVVTDEAHTLSKWAFTFRPAYRKIGRIIEEDKPDVVLTLTATSTKEIETDVRNILGIQDAEKIFYYPRRKELKLASLDYTTDDDLIRHVQAVEGSCIVYCATVKKVQDLADKFNQVMLPESSDDDLCAKPFFGEMSPSLKTETMDDFMSGRTRIIVATNAFGMGIDKGNIRAVIHRDIPGSLEALAQEVGRAGRDGKDSYCLAFYDPASFETQKFFIRKSYPERRDVVAVYKALRSMADSSGIARAPGKDLAEVSGVWDAYIHAVISHLTTFDVIEKYAPKDEMALIRIEDEAELPKLQEYMDLVRNLGALDEQGHYAVDVMQMAQMLDVRKQTVEKNLKEWQRQGFITYQPPYRGAQYRIIGDLSRVDFDFLEARLEQEYTKLELVRDYLTCPDERKHEFLEKYFTKLNEKGEQG